MEEREACGASVLPAAAPELDEDEAASDSEQPDEAEPSDYDPYYDHTDIANRFYACEIEEIPSFRWMTPSQRQVDATNAVERDEGSPEIPLRAAGGATTLQIQLDRLVALKLDLESRIQLADHLPKSEVEDWLEEVEKERRRVEILLARPRRNSSPFFLGAWFQRQGGFGQRLNAVDQLHRQRAEWSDDDIFREPESVRDVRAESSSSSPPIPTTPQRSDGEILLSNNLKVFAFSALEAATRNFRPDSILGEGAFGPVFKGWIKFTTLAAARPGTGTVVAVKTLRFESFQGHPEWLNEIKYLSQLHHPNLIKLLGYCLHDKHRLLVYEFMPKGSLHNHLLGRGSHSQSLSWNLRMKIALEAAKAMAFLHNAKPQVIHRNFTSSNILLDSSYNAKLSDFGIARDGPIDDETHVSTRVMGTYGYAAPEYVATGHLTSRCDVYNFGVVLLELLTGRNAIDTSRPFSKHCLVEWARPELCHKRRIYSVLDPRFEGQYPITGAQRAAELALKCICVEPRFRPGMVEVVVALEQLQNTWEVSSSDGVVGQRGVRRN